MADTRLGVQESGTPTHYIANAERANDNGDTVLFQQIEAPELMAILRRVAEGLNRFGAAFDATGRMYVALTNPAGTAQNVNAVQSGTWNITTLTNQAQMGGYLTNPIVFSQMQSAANFLRSGIVVS